MCVVADSQGDLVVFPELPSTFVGLSLYKRLIIDRSCSHTTELHPSSGAITRTLTAAALTASLIQSPFITDMGLQIYNYLDRSHLEASRRWLKCAIRACHQGVPHYLGRGALHGF